MAELRSLLKESGFPTVRTYIQSGNVLLESDKAAAAIERIVHDIIADAFGGDLTVVALTVDQLQQAVDKIPFREYDTRKIYFTFFARQPLLDVVAEFLEEDFGQDTVEIVEGVVYTLYGTKHSDSKWNNNVYERRLGVRATTRNWNTTTRLVAMGMET